MTRMVKAILMGLCGCLVLSFCGFQAVCEDISERVLRLHILANSDSEEDQALKLLVRDAILEETKGELDGALSTPLAKQRLPALLPTMEEIARDCLAANGSDYTVKAELCNMYFETRYYDQGAMPAGYYDAVRITIGEGEGHNWWCVMFPPMCVKSAESTAVEEVLTAQEADVVQHPERYEVRFKLVEWFYAVCRWFS